IEAYTDWIYGGRFHDIFGRLTYRGNPVYGFSTTRYGAPEDGYGRLLYLDTYDSAYGPGWRRENSFVAHNPTGVFCYGFYPFEIEAYTDWIYGGRFHDIFGRLTYRGNPVYGFSTTRYGAPEDGYGRLLYLDTYDSAYGPGWRRENSFVAHNPTGVFCYGFYPF